MKSKLIKIQQLTNTKYLNMFQADFSMENGKTRQYYFASRRSLQTLGYKNLMYVDAVKVLPYFLKDGKTFVVLNNEFRSPLNAYTFDLCAGIVDNQDDLEQDVKREVFEEIGASVKSLEKVTNVGHTSAGLTDETIVCYFAEVENFGEQHLEDTEDILLKIIELKQIPEFLNNNQVGTTASLLLQLFYYKNKN